MRHACFVLLEEFHFIESEDMVTGEVKYVHPKEGE